MGFNSEFDKQVEDIKHVIPEKLHGAMIFVNDTLKICRQSGEEIFSDKMKPEYAFDIYDRIVEMSDIKTTAKFDSALEDDCEEKLESV